MPLTIPSLWLSGSSLADQIGALFAQAGIAGDYYPASRLSSRIMVKKLRSDYPEFAVYAPITPDGIFWDRWYFTNRLNTGNSGSSRMVRNSEALLYQSNIIAPLAENQTTGTEGQASTVTKVAADATRVGTWTAPATIGGVTDVSYSTLIGDTSTYSITGAARLALRSYANTSNGGVIAVTIKESGVEIAAANYRVPLNGAVRTVDLKVIGTGLNWTPIADALDPSKTYSVEIAVAATNPAGGRAYDGGLRGYALTAYNAVGRHGTWFTQAFSAASTVGDYLSGGKVIYQCTNTSKINWKFVTTPNSGKVKFKVYDNAGAEIAGGKYVNTTYDCYLAANNLITVPVALGLAVGTYYLVVETDTTKNASSTGYRIYDAGVAAYNETVGGTLGVDAFDDQGLTGLSIEGTCTLIGIGNLELAVNATKSAEAPSSGNFVGGVHGHESAPSNLALVLDGAAIDFAGAAVGASWIGASLGISFNTSLLHISDSSVFASVVYNFTVSREGFAVDTPRVLSSDVKIVEDYPMMLNVPSAAVGTQGAHGGFQNFAALGDVPATRVFNAGDDSSNALSKQVSLGMFWNDTYVVVAQITNIDEINAHYADSAYAGARALSFVQDRSDKFVKWYDRAFSGSDTGVIVPAGDSISPRKIYRVLKRGI